MKFLQAGVIYAGANMMSAAVPFLLLPILTRVLDPVEHGRIVSFALFVTLCLTVAGLNAHAALGVLWFTRPKEEIPGYVGTALALAAVSSVLIAALVGLALYLFPQLGAGLTPGWGAVAALTAGAQVIIQCRLVLWQSQRKAVQSATVQVILSVVNMSLSLFFVLTLGWGGDGRNAGIAVAAALVAGIAVALFLMSRDMQLSFRREQLATLAAFGSPLILHSLGSLLLSTADRWFVSVQLGGEMLGIYGAGAQLGMVMAMLADAFVKIYSPWLYAKLVSSNVDDKHYAVGAIYTAMPAFFVAAVMVGGALYLASGLLLGPQFRQAAAVLPWFMLGGAFGGVYLCTSVLFFFSGRTGLLAAVTLSCGVSGAIVSWILIATYGVTGAAAGYAAMQGLLALIITLVAVRSFDLPWGDARRAMAVWLRSVFGDLGRQAA